MSLNSVSFDRQDRRETYLVGQQNTLKNRADLLSVVDEHAGDGRCAYQVAGAVVDIGEQADSAIAINRKRSGEGFVGKGTAHAGAEQTASRRVNVRPRQQRRVRRGNVPNILRVQAKLPEKPTNPYIRHNPQPTPSRGREC